MADDISRPPSPSSRSDSPNLFAMGYFSIPFERFIRDEGNNTDAFTLLDTMETFFDSRIDLLQRNLSKRTDKLKMRAEVALNDIFKGKPPTPEALTENFDREVQKLRLKVSTRMANLAAAWQSTKVVRTREKISFFYGVMSLLVTALLFGMAPEYVHIAYTVQALYLIPYRYITYKKLNFQYFMLDNCYFTMALNFIYVWLFPQSPALFIACYTLSHGPLASAVITWRNSLVFHDQDKVTSLFIHIYAPLVFTVIRHRYPNAHERFPAVAELQHIHPWRALLQISVIYLVWQILYWKFVMVDRRKKIESGQRTTSFSFLLNNKRGLIGRALASVKPERRETIFMFGQFVYSVLTAVPGPFLFYESSFWSGAFLLVIFSVSVWNGGGFYIEVFGRKFEKELENLRKELAEANSALRSTRSSPTFAPSDSDLSMPVSPIVESKKLADEVASAAIAELSEVSEAKKDR